VVTLDGSEARRIEIDAAGLYDLAVHDHHEAHTLELSGDAGVEIYSISFSAALPE
jgi:hypothetical protein